MRSSVTSSVRTCPLGCPGDGAALLELPTTMDVALSRSHFTLARCSCGQLLYLSPAPSHEDLRAMYVDNRQFGEEYTDAERVRQILAYVCNAFESIAGSRQWSREQPLRILEVGAGLAWMCRAARMRNPCAITVAQDVSPEAVAHCAWVEDYVQGSIDDPRVALHAPYDVISLTHVIEHLVDPVETLRRCASLLATGGVVFVTAPFRPVGWRDDAPDLATWRGYSYNHVPAHVQYFSEGSMRRLAERIGLGLERWSDRHDGGQAFEAWLARAGVDARFRRPRGVRALLAAMLPHRRSGRR